MTSGDVQLESLVLACRTTACVVDSRDQLQTTPRLLDTQHTRARALPSAVARTGVFYERLVCLRPSDKVGHTASVERVWSRAAQGLGSRSSKHLSAARNHGRTRT